MGRVISLEKEQKQPVRWGKGIYEVAHSDRNANSNCKIWPRPEDLVTAQVGEEMEEGTIVLQLSLNISSFLGKFTQFSITEVFI